MNVADALDIEEPITYFEACKSKHWLHWKAAMDEEMKSLVKNETWVLVEKPKDQKVTGCKLIFKRKP